MTSNEPNWTTYALTADPNKPLREAREEIERLREQLRLANIDNFNTTAEVERLRAERDEARRMWCDEIWLLRGGRMSVDAIARERGWDCFKEEQ